MHGGTAHFKKTDTLKDPLNSKYLYSNGCRKDLLNDKSKYVLLTKEYGITKISTNCNTTSTIGQISFGFDGKIYSQLGTNIKEIQNQCVIKLFNEKEESISIAVEPYTGYIHKI